MNDDNNIVSLEEIRKQIDSTTKTVEVFSNDDPRLEKLNSKHAFIHSVGGKPMITNNVYNVAFDGEIMEFITPRGFEIIYCNETVQVENTKIELGRWWLRHSERKQYNTIIFDPSRPKEYNNCLNLWEGFAVVPTKGSWKYTLKHIYKILCNSDREKFIYLIKWLAWSVQNPGNRAGVAVCLKGLKGTGKSFLFSQFVKIFGRHGISISNREHLTGKFNAHLGLCCFLFADEAYYPGDLKTEGVIKQLITEENIPIERKGFDLGISKNNMHVAMATNNDWVIPASDDERRYFINKVEDKYAKNKISDLERNLYFSRLFVEMDKGGREAMLYDLLNMNLGSWMPYHDVPRTEELEIQVELSRGKLESALFEILDSGLFPGNYDGQEYLISSRELYSYLDSLEPLLAKLSEVKKSRLVKELGAIKRRASAGNIWVFPQLVSTRRAWENKYGKTRWSNGFTEWQIEKSPY